MASKLQVTDPSCWLAPPLDRHITMERCLSGNGLNWGKLISGRNEGGQHVRNSESFCSSCSYSLKNSESFLLWPSAVAPPPVNQMGRCQRQRQLYSGALRCLKTEGQQLGPGRPTTSSWSLWGGFFSSKISNLMFVLDWMKVSVFRLLSEHVRSLNDFRCLKNYCWWCEDLLQPRSRIYVFTVSVLYDLRVLKHITDKSFKKRSEIMIRDQDRRSGSEIGAASHLP